jgi:hypothetical protein
MAGQWNHNVHYHRVIFEAIPPLCDRALDVGCGTGRQPAARHEIPAPPALAVLHLLAETRLRHPAGLCVRRQNLAEPGREPVGMAAEPAVAPRELRWLAAQPLRQRV